MPDWQEGQSGSARKFANLFSEGGVIVIGRNGFRLDLWGA
jgi:hypothetical protein